MNTRSKTSNMDNPEFLIIPPPSSRPPTVVPPPPTSIAVTEFTLSPGTMDQAPNVVSSSQFHIPQPTTSSPSLVLDIASSTAVTSAESLHPSNPSQLQRGNIPVNLVMDGSVVNRNKGSSSRSTYCRSTRYSQASRRGRSDGAGNSEDTIIQVRSEQARAGAEAKAKARAAQEEQQHIQEVQEKQLAIKKRGIELQLEGRRKEAEREAEEAKSREDRRIKEADREAKENEIRAEQDLLALEGEQLQARSESWMRNQQAIQEALIIEAGAEAEADAIIQETDSRATSPNLGLEGLTTNEKMSKFLGTPEPEECSQKDYFNPMVFHLSAFDSVRPKQTLVNTHPVMTTTTTPASHMYVPPPQLSFRA